MGKEEKIGIAYFNSILVFLLIFIMPDGISITIDTIFLGKIILFGFRLL